jgi:hypothetical protein
MIETKENKCTFYIPGDDNSGKCIVCRRQKWEHS